jgi:agmatine deiminase
LIKFFGRKVKSVKRKNTSEIVPTFNDPNDRVALGILGELFRDRPVIGIHAVDLVWGFGSLHCLTQQQPV